MCTEAPRRKTRALNPIENDIVVENDIALLGACAATSLIREKGRQGVACMWERLCEDSHTCAPTDSVYAFASIKFHGDTPWGGRRRGNERVERGGVGEG